MAGDPCEVERDQRAEEMAAVDGAEPVGEEKVVDNPGPEAFGDAERWGFRSGEPFESKQRVRWQNEGPDFLKVGIGEPESLDHWAKLRRYFAA